jgi:hypothetical protein
VLWLWFVVIVALKDIITGLFRKYWILFVQHVKIKWLRRANMEETLRFEVQLEERLFTINSDTDYEENWEADFNRGDYKTLVCLDRDNSLCIFPSDFKNAVYPIQVYTQKKGVGL